MHYQGEKVPFVCECPDLSCTDLVELTLDDYEDIRTAPTRFFVVPGHQALAVQAGAAVVIEERDDVCISEKVGIAGEVAARHHGRRNGAVDDRVPRKREHRAARHARRASLRTNSSSAS